MSIIFSLSLSPSFFRLISWSIEAPCVHLSARVSKTWTGRRSASSLPWETGKAPVASVNRANFLSRSFIGFLCKPRNISLCLSSIFLSTIFFPYLCLNHPPTPFFLQVPLDPAGARPRLLVMIDTFTGWIEGFPTQTEKAEEVVNQLLHEIILRFGLPRSLQSNNGT